MLLIACVNLAGLLLARTASRQRELAIRLALGAGRFGVVRHLLTENLILAAAGGAAGILLTAVSGRPLMEFLLSPGAYAVYSTTPDSRVLLFALSLTALTAVALAFVPLFQIRQTQLTDSLKPEGGGFAGRAHVRFRKALVVLQIAFCVWLVIAAGLLARSLMKLRAVDLGFEKENLIVFYLDPSLGGYEAAQSHSILLRVDESLASIPGISAVGSSDYGVMMGKGINLNRLEIEGYEPRRTDETWVYQVCVTPGYMKALGLKLLKGRDFTPADMTANATIVNKAFADRYFGGKNPVGQDMHSAFNKDYDMEIIGLVENQKYFGPRQEWAPFYYQPFRHNGGVTYYLRTSQPPQTLISTVRKTVERQAPGVPIYRMQTMESRIGRLLDSDRQATVLASFFGLFALFLAEIGLYGVMAYTVTRRTREIGIRMALGAAPSRVMGMVIREVGLVVGLGLLIGIPSGLALTPRIQSQLYDTSPADPLASAIAAVVVAVIGLLAALAPARRATRIDPMTALRWE